MTTTETPAATLRRAAEAIREVGQAARARGPFFVEGQCFCYDDEDYEDQCTHRKTSWRVRTEVPHDPTILSYEVTSLHDEADARWIATMSPVVAEPLARLLEDDAKRVSWTEREPAKNWPTPESFATLAVARAVLGETGENQ